MAARLFLVAFLAAVVGAEEEYVLSAPSAWAVEAISNSPLSPPPRSAGDDVATAAVSIALYHSVGAAPFTLRCRLRAELAPAAAALAAAPAAAAAAAAATAPRWRVRAEGGDKGGFSEAELPALAAAAAAGGSYRVRARVLGRGDGESVEAAGAADADVTSAIFVTAATKLCLLLSAPELRHDVFLALDGAGALRSLDVRPALPAGFAGCAGAAPPAAAVVPTRAVAFAHSRFGTVPIEESPAVPALNAGKGAPYIGQGEIKEKDAARIAAAVAAAQEGGGADADAAPAGLDAAESAPPPEPSLYQRAMPYVIGAYIVYSLASRFLGREEEPEQAGARVPGARRAARAPAAAAR